MIAELEREAFEFEKKVSQNIDLISDSPEFIRKKISIRSANGYRSDAVSAPVEMKVVHIDEMFEDVILEIKRVREDLKKVTSAKESLQTDLEKAHHDVRTAKQELELLEKQKIYYENQCSQSDLTIKELRENHEKERQALEKVIQTQNSAFSRVVKKKDKQNEDLLKKSAMFSESRIQDDPELSEDMVNNLKKKISLLERNIRSLLSEKKEISGEISKLKEKLDYKENEITSMMAELRMKNLELEILSTSNQELTSKIDLLKSRNGKIRNEFGSQTDFSNILSSVPTLNDLQKMEDLEETNRNLMEKLESIVKRDLEMQLKYEDAIFRLKLMEKIIKEKKAGF